MASERSAHAANVLKLLAKSPKPLTAYELLDQLRAEGVTAPTTVYRALDKLMQTGKIHKLETLGAFVACRDVEHGHPETHSHQGWVGFAICDRCGSVNEFLDSQLEQRIRDDVGERAFVARSSNIEVHGICGVCTSKEAVA